MQTEPESSRGMFCEGTCTKAYTPDIVEHHPKKTQVGLIGRQARATRVGWARALQWPEFSEPLPPEIDKSMPRPTIAS